MQIEITAESLLKQLKLSVNETSLAQMDNIINNTPNSLKFFKHIFSLNDALSHMDAFVAPSSSENFLKIKLHDSAKLTEFNKAVSHWADKYKVQLDKVDSKEVYYIKGHLD
jgi:hypothetical protein